LLLNFALLRPMFEYASVACDSITSTDIKKLEHIKRKFASLCQHCFFSDWNVMMTHFSVRCEDITFKSFLINIYTGFINCPSLLDPHWTPCSSSQRLRRFLLHTRTTGLQRCIFRKPNTVSKYILTLIDFN
jgi:hypothetical protein